MNARALIENDDVKGEILQVEGLPSPDEVTYTLTAEEEDTEPNWERPTDNEADAIAFDEMIDGINRRRRRGDLWAWCIAVVEATWTNMDGITFNGRDNLGGCSYESAADFKVPGGYYDDMKREAYDRLLQKIQASH